MDNQNESPLYELNAKGWKKAEGQKFADLNGQGGIEPAYLTMS